MAALSMTAPASYGPDDVLTAQELAPALKVSTATVNRMPYLPWFYIGRLRRVRWGSVLRVLEERDK